MKQSLVFLSIFSCFIRICPLNDIKIFDEKSDISQAENENYFVEGFVFKDMNHSGTMGDDERVSQLKMNLWQENNLMDTILTDEEGYYCFEGLQKDKKYQITAECFSDCTLMQKYPDEDITNDFTIMQDYQVKTEEFVMDQVFKQYNLGLTPIAYHVHYQLNGGIGAFQQDEKAYGENTEVQICSASSLTKEGYIFVGWNTQKDGTGYMYQSEQTLQMPSHNLTLYAIWKEDVSSASVSQTVSIQKVKQASVVETSDEYNLTSLLLMFLSSIGGLLVVKSLKKNR